MYSYDDYDVLAQFKIAFYKVTMCNYNSCLYEKMAKRGVLVIGPKNIILLLLYDLRLIMLLLLLLMSGVVWI